MSTDVIVSLQGVSLLPEDRFVNTLHFTGDDWGTGQLDELWSKYETWLGLFGGGLAAAGHRIAAYAPGVNPGGPYVAKDYALSGALNSVGPAEVALCLSYATVDDPDASTPRRRGRIYLGPIKGPNVAEARPGVGLISAALDLGEGIAQVGLASNVTWAAYSKADNTYTKIESIWVDDSWDTQRRRGLAPTARTVRDVQ